MSLSKWNFEKDSINSLKSFFKCNNKFKQKNINKTQCQRLIDTDYFL